jgi:hypothetical protein
VAPAKKATKPAKKAAAPAKKATKRIPAQKPLPASTAATEPAHVIPITEPPTDTIIEVPEPPLWHRLRANPQYAPELLALAAVERLGAQADRYTSWLRATYPQATPDSLAGLARQRFTQHARYAVLVSAAANPVAEIAGLVWTQARLVLHVAAAYGRDPTDPERAAELLALMRVHPNEEIARAALAAATHGDHDDPLAGGAGWRLAQLLAGPLGGRGLRRLAGRLAPGLGLAVGALVNGGAMERLGRRATEYYRGR